MRGMRFIATTWVVILLLGLCNGTTVASGVCVPYTQEACEAAAAANYQLTFVGASASYSTNGCFAYPSTHSQYPNQVFYGTNAVITASTAANGLVDSQYRPEGFDCLSSTVDNVMLFFDPTYVDTVKEADNLYDDLAALGLSVSADISYASGDIYNGLLTPYKYFVIPEGETGYVNTILSSWDKTTIKSWVEAGGVFVIAGDYDNKDTQLMNSIFSWGVSGGQHANGDETFTKTAAAASTCFANAPSTITTCNGDSLLSKSGLPNAATVIYEYGTADAAVVLFDVGYGHVIYYSFDWYTENCGYDTLLQYIIPCRAVDCDASWSACNNMACTETYSITKTPEVGGAACVATAGYSQTCADSSLCAVNCVGSYGGCDNLYCTETFTQTTAAANGGTACVAAHGAQQTCPDDSNCAEYWVAHGDFGDICNDNNGDCSTQMMKGYTIQDVKCCADVDNGQGWMAPDFGSCTNYHESFDCQSLNFWDASTFCQSKGGRLCTVNELEARCAQANGCVYDYELVWAGESCSPYSQEACEDAAANLGLTFVNAGNHNIDGCYAYPADHSTYPNQAYFGTGAVLTAATVDNTVSAYGNSVYRPEGFDCGAMCTPYTVQACQNAASLLGLTFVGSSSTYATDGCYAFPATHATYANQVYFGTSNTLTVATYNNGLDDGKYRPEGFDCHMDCVGSYGSCENTMCDETYIHSIPRQNSGDKCSISAGVTQKCPDETYCGHHWVVHGEPGEMCLDNDGDCSTQLMADYTIQDVRCCATVDNGAGWMAPEEGCFVYHESFDCQSLNYVDARNFCISKGGRLCTVAEIEMGCPQENGCDFDYELVWANQAEWTTSTSACQWPLTYQGIKYDGRNCIQVSSYSPHGWCPTVITSATTYNSWGYCQPTVDCKCSGGLTSGNSLGDTMCETESTHYCTAWSSYGIDGCPSGANACSLPSIDCNLQVGGSAVVDVCGVCGGDGTSCLDCAGTINGNLVADECGVCNGDGSTCCEPYTQDACEKAAANLGLTYAGTGAYATDGCYAYPADHMQYPNKVYFGTNAVVNVNTVMNGLDNDKYRPVGHDCLAQCYPYSLQACKDAGTTLGLTWGSSGNWNTNGCYAYPSNHGTINAGKVFFGTSVTLTPDSIDDTVHAYDNSVYRPDGFDCQCGAADVTSSTTLVAAGWTIGVGNSMGGSSAVQASCGSGTSWYGWDSNDNVGSITYTATSDGYFSLTFKNCWEEGTVGLYINDVLTVSALPLITKVVHHASVSAGDTIRLQDDGSNSKIQLQAFSVCYQPPVIDCVGYWGSCDNSKCTQTYHLVIPAENGGASCPASNMATQTCSDATQCNYFYVAHGDFGDFCYDNNGDCSTQLMRTDTIQDVKCCADTSLGIGWMSPESGCSVYHESFDCQSLTYWDASAFCNGKGGRLCTVAELENRCAQANGCSYDYELVWAQDPYACEAYSETTCWMAAIRNGMTWGGSGSYETNGCYAYPATHGTYPNKVFFGTDAVVTAATEEDTLYAYDSSVFRPAGFDCQAACTPYTQEACEDAAATLGLEFVSAGAYDTDGCYAYPADHVQLANKVYFGTNHMVTIENMGNTLDGTKYRPDGFDCQCGTTDVSSYGSMVAAGWTIDTTANAPNAGVAAQCGNNAYFYGWNPSSLVGQITYAVPGDGYFSIDFKNCWYSGTVDLYVNDVKVAGTDGSSGFENTAVSVNHYFVAAGDEIKLMDNGLNSIIQLEHFSICQTIDYADSYWCTTDNTCKWPLTYGGVTYHGGSCLDKNSYGPDGWCATSLTDSGSYSSWGYCEPCATFTQLDYGESCDDYTDCDFITSYAQCKKGFSELDISITGEWTTADTSYVYGCSQKMKPEDVNNFHFNTNTNGSPRYSEKPLCLGECVVPDVCVPYSAQACADAAVDNGLTYMGTGAYDTNGCYAYTSDHDEHANTVYFGTVATVTSLTVGDGLNGDKYRPKGLDCADVCVPYSLEACQYAAAAWEDLTFVNVGTYSQASGCFAYPDDHETYPNQVFFGVNKMITDDNVNEGLGGDDKLYRPEGSDCPSGWEYDNYGFHLTHSSDGGLTGGEIAAIVICVILVVCCLCVILAMVLGLCGGGEEKETGGGSGHNKLDEMEMAETEQVTVNEGTPGTTTPGIHE